MDMATNFPPWLIWFVVGIAVSLSELLIPGFVIIFFGIGCLGAAAFAVALPDLYAGQIATFILVTVVSLLVLRRLAMRDAYAVLGHARAYDYMFSLLKQSSISEEDLLYMVIEAESVRAGVHIHTFTFLHKHQVRVVTENGKLWMPVNDLGNALGYAAPANWVTMGLPKTWDGKLAFDRFYGTPSIISPLPSKSHAPDCRVLSEEAVRVMLERSTKTDADAFKNWLYGVIIPQLQKGGWYGHPERTVALESAPAGHGLNNSGIDCGKSPVIGSCHQPALCFSSLNEVLGDLFALGIRLLDDSTQRARD